MHDQQRDRRNARHPAGVLPGEIVLGRMAVAAITRRFAKATALFGQDVESYYFDDCQFRRRPLSRCVMFVTSLKGSERLRSFLIPCRVIPLLLGAL
jgi:hypothetical protein